MQRPFGWYVRRIRTMGGRELMHRAREYSTVRRLARSHRRGAAHAVSLVPSDSEFCRADSPQLPSLPWAEVGDAERASILAGHWPALGHAWQWRDDEAVWHEAPDTGRAWPREFFGSIPYLGGNPYGDVRVAWEPSRLQQLIALALIANDENDAGRAVALLERQLLSFCAANPPLTGIHYISVMECAQRIIAACFALDMVRSQLIKRDAVWRALLGLVQSHASIIAKRPSLYSSTGNHTVAEAAGLVFAGVLFPEFDEASAWRELGLRLLGREADRQVLPDGGGIEQSFQYALLVVDLIGLVERLLRHRGLDAPDSLTPAFERGRAFLRTFADSADALPTTGDSDGGFAVSKYLRLVWDGPADVDGRDHTFDHAGYTVISTTPDQGALRLVFDHAPFGMAPLFGHSHADALSMTLRAADEDLLIDPGTYCYVREPEWRGYFRSTRAHNTVTVDGRDQATQELSFMWSDAHAAELMQRESDDDGLLILARHRGGYGADITHWRGIAFRAGAYLAVIDRVTGRGEHTLELNWHCRTPPTQYGSQLKLASEFPVALEISGGAISVHSAENDPKLGWRSPAYGVRLPAFTISARWSGPLPHGFVTTISLGGESADADGDRERALATLSGWIDTHARDTA